MKNIVLIGTFFFWVVAGPALAGQPGWAFLKMDTGAKGAAMGETMIATVGDPSSGFYNPAGITEFQGREWAFSHVEWFQGIRAEGISFTRGRGHRTIALGVIVQTADEIERRTQASTQPLGNFGVYDMRINLMYAQQYGRLSIGGATKLISEKILEESSLGITADIGAVYAIHPFLIGWSLRNFGTAGKMKDRSGDLPVDWNVGLAYKPSRYPVTIAGAARMSGRVDQSDKSAGDRELNEGFGIEYQPTDRLFLRGGYHTGIEGGKVSTGIGVILKRWTIDYAFVPFDFGLGETHRITLRVR
jgi:hypothetical protein